MDGLPANQLLVKRYSTAVGYQTCTPNANRGLEIPPARFMLISEGWPFRSRQPKQTALGTRKGWPCYLVESKSASRDIIPGNDMNSPIATFARLSPVASLVLWLAVACIPAAPLLAQDFKVNIGGGDAEKAKVDKELADKLPPEQAAAYLKSHHVWSTLGDTLQCLIVFSFPIGVIALVQTFRHRRQKLAHETMRLMIEKGLPVPPELINPPPPVKPPKSDLRRGLIWLALGIGLMVLAKNATNEPGVWSVGLVPALIGAAYLLCWIVSQGRERREAGHEPSSLWRGIFWTFLGASLALALRSLEHASGDWDELAAWWGVGLIPIGIGVAFLLHALVLWWLSHKKLTQG